MEQTGPISEIPSLNNKLDTRSMYTMELTGPISELPSLNYKLHKERASRDEITREWEPLRGRGCWVFFLHATLSKRESTRGDAVATKADVHQLVTTREALIK